MTTFTKLSNGNWGVRSTVKFSPGDSAVVTLKSGGTKTVKIDAFAGMAGVDRLYAIVPEAKPEAPKIVVGDLSAIVALFDKARKHLQYPKITLDGFRVSVAGPNAKVPGSLSIVSAKTNDQGVKEWFGRVETNGTFRPSPKCPATVADQLKQFAANPAAVAARYGKLNGSCCFCGLKLGAKDKSKAPSATALKSLAVGYGKDCAEHYGLPWGEVVTNDLVA